jgi:hypothetical protein
MGMMRGFGLGAFGLRGSGASGVLVLNLLLIAFDLLVGELDCELSGFSGRHTGFDAHHERLSAVSEKLATAFGVQCCGKGDHDLLFQTSGMS